MDETFCVAGRIRLLARRATALYNEAFAAEGVTFAQAGLLMRLFAQPGIRQSALSKQLLIEKSALNRDLQLLQRNGWLTDDLRRGLFLTDAGRDLAKRCHKIWKALNQRVRDEVGPDALAGLEILTEKFVPKQS